VAIVAVKTTQTQRTLYSSYDNYRDFDGGWGWRSFGGGGFGKSDTTEQDYKDGTLVVDLFDAKTKQLIWRGSAEDVLSDKAEMNEKNLEKRRCSRISRRALQNANRRLLRRAEQEVL